MLTDLRTSKVSLCNISSRKKCRLQGLGFPIIEIELVIQASLRETRHISRLKEERKLCLQSVEKKRDVFGIPPTGFEKTLTFQVLPCVTKETWKIERSTVLVVSPLVFNMKDQAEELSRLRMKAFALGLGDDEEEKELRMAALKVGVRMNGPKS